MSPIRFASLVSLVYLVPSAIYIFISSTVVTQITESALEAAIIEIFKGFGFILFSSLLIFGICWKTLSIARRKNEEAHALAEAYLRAERQGLASTLAAAIAHDARNELTILRSNTQYLEQTPNLDESIAEIYREQSEAIDRLTDLTELLTSSGKTNSLQTSRHCRVSRAVHQVIGSLRDHPRLTDVTITVDVAEPDDQILIYPSMLHQSLINLLFNAADATKGAGKILVTVASNNDGVTIEVHDDGPGFPPASENRLFDAFYTTKEYGTGLGLVSVKACALAHGGTVEPRPSRLGGACIALTLFKATDDPYDTASFGLRINAPSRPKQTTPVSPGDAPG